MKVTSQRSATSSVLSHACGQLAEDVAHLLGRLQVVAVTVQREPVGVVHRRARLDAQQGVVAGGVLLVGVVQVVGGDQREPEVLRDPEQVGADPALDVESVVHQLDEVAVGPEEVAVVRRRGQRIVVLAEPEQGLHLTRRTAGRREDPVVVALQELAVHARLVELALHRGERRQPEQVVHALGGLGQHGDVGVGAAARDVVLVALAAAVAPADPATLEPAGAGREVGLDPDDRADPAGPSLLVEVERTEHVAVVGDRQGRHLEPGGLVEQLADPGRSVEHGVLGMGVQVHETIRHQRWTPSATTRTSRTGRHTCDRRCHRGGRSAWGKIHSLRRPTLPDTTDTRDAPLGAAPRRRSS